jgi:dinuclear metal center YbgI/SA1388 family protein
MKLKELSSFLDSSIPVSFQENYDNSGLQIGDPECEISSALLAVDVTEEVVNEALSIGCSLIISHHPLLFGGIKHIIERNYTERVVRKCIKNDISVYSAHTNLDSVENGVSYKMAEKLGLLDVKVLSPLEDKLLKLVTYIPEKYLDRVRNAIFEAGAGVIGNYDQCGYIVQGKGSFRANEFAEPFVGEKGKIHIEDEIRFETVMFSHSKNKVIEALIDSHPYEEVAYDLYSLENTNIRAGFGCIGQLPEAMNEKDFLKYVSTVFDAKGIRYSGFTGRKMSRIAVCGGSGSSFIGKAVSMGSDAYVTADLKYHNFFDADRNILLVDTGHYESEKFATEILNELIIKKFPKFALRFSKTNTNPINYL